MGKRQQGNPHLKQAMLEVVDNQLRDNNPAETGQTYERLMGEGHSEKKSERADRRRSHSRDLLHHGSKRTI